MIATSASAQLVSVRCCTEESHLTNIEDCVSGPGNITQPASCPPSATCVLGFGEDTQLMAALCDLDGKPKALPSRALCSIWAIEASPAAQKCVAKPHLIATLFSVYDDDGDGDLDATDVAAFEKVREPLPRTQQTEATLTYLECCLAVRGIGRCLSGPGATTPPIGCEALASCLAGFSQPVLPGDYLHGLCGSDPVFLPKPKDSYCLGWQTDETPTDFLCTANPVPGVSLFTISDADEDSDVDLRDFAAAQVAFAR